MDQFSLEGVTYYQQERKCGKRSCHCAKGGKMHGPYWYARPEHGKIRYVGKLLPDHIAEVRKEHDRRLAEMVQERRRLAREFDAVTRLIRNDELIGGDRAILAELGFDSCLV